MELLGRRRARARDGDAGGLFGFAAIARTARSARYQRVVEAVTTVALGFLGLVLLFVVQDIAGFQLHGYIILPLMALVASRFGPHGVAACALTLGLVSVAYTVNGHGPFAESASSSDARVAQVQLFVFSTTIPMQLLAANVTQRRRLERERNDMRERLAQRERMDSLGQLAGGIAHDFNNILQVISNSTVLAEDSMEEGLDGRAELGAIRDAVRRGAELVASLHSMVRGGGDDRPWSVPDTVLSSMELLLRRIAPPLGSLTVRGRASGKAVGMSRTDFERVLMNLVTNARDALVGGRGTIDVRTLLDGDRVCLVVRDTGCGIPADRLDAIWEPFFTARASGSGTGLGLSSVQAIVARAEGSITVESTEGAGSTFRVYLPVVNAAERAGRAG